MANEVNTMPHNRDAEMALLGCLLMDNEITAELIEKLTQDDFYQESHKYILHAMQRVFNNRKPVDLVTVSDELESEASLEKAGGLMYLTELTQITPSAANYKSYYEIVTRDSVNRKLIRASRKIIETAMKGVNEKDSLAFAEKTVYDISKQTERSALLGMADDDIIGDVLDKFQKLQSDPDSFKGIPTGFKRLDKMTNGLQAGALIVLAARPGKGKTSLAMNIVENAAMHAGKTCAVFSLEMPRSEIVQRLICSYANVSMAKALSGDGLSAKEWKKLMLAGDQLKKSNIYIDDSSRVTPAEILSKCRRLKTTNGGIDLIMIDYIQLMSSGDSNIAGAENRQQEVASITRDLKIMAKELRVPVIALSQLRRIQSKEPQLSDLRESGAIEQDADIVMFISRPEAVASKEEIEKGTIVKGAAELILAKHRAGEQGRVPLKFIGEYTKFVNVEDQNREDEPPQYGTTPVNYEDDEEYVAPDDDYGSPEPPMPRKSDLRAIDDELPFE